MNFVDAAVALLREADAPLHVEELCRLALERGLLDSPGANPLRSFKGRLTTELKRGDESRVARVEDDRWTLSETGREGGEPAARAEGEEEGSGDDAHEAERYELVDPGEDEDDDDDELAAAPDEEDDDEEGDELAEAVDEEGNAEPPRELSPEEAELVAVYGDEVGTAQVGALSEFRDAQTADEDRPMTPEMTGERRGRREREDWKSRRERMRRERREKREARERDRDARASGNGASGAAAPAPRENAAADPW
jgi:hypothetical protein